MGASHSRQSSQDEDFYIESGVRVTQGLLEQLHGKPRAPRAPAGLPLAGGAAAAAAAATSQALRSAGGEEAALSDAALIRADRSLARALERSRHVGGLLLKAEEEELGRVGALADELLASEYAAPARARPCAEQAQDCVRCYAEHGGDPLACAAAVQAYSACAKAAWSEAVARSAV